MGFEDGEAGYVTPGVEADEVAHEGLGPGFGAAVWWGRFFFRDVHVGLFLCCSRRFGLLEMSDGQVVR